MGAKIPQRRNKTAKQLAAELGVSTRAIGYAMAEPRDQFEARAAERRGRVVELRNAGRKYADIADELELTIGQVASILSVARSKGEIGRASRFVADRIRAADAAGSGRNAPTAATG